MLVYETTVIAKYTGTLYFWLKIFNRIKMNLVIILMFVVFLVTVSVLANQKSTDKDVNEIEKFLSSNRERSKSIV